ncbi:MAG: hypothetical protein IJ010_01035 [Ruminococcus sp.]|nr:hypothetical protein [Ruminococcus sp.]
MNVTNQKGMSIGISVAIYQVIKLVLNMILGGGLDTLTLIIGAAAFILAITGIKYGNYAVAIALALIALTNLPANISNIGSNWIYLIEGIIDILAAVVLCTNSDVKEQFSRGLK